MKKGLSVIALPSLGVLLYFFHAQFVCIFHEMTGLYCPGCGMGRCISALIHFDWYQAFRFNLGGI